MKKRYWQLLIGTGLLIIGAFIALYLFKGSTPAFAPANLPGSLFTSPEAQHRDGLVYRITDESNALVTKMSRLVSVGDEIITADGKHYRVNRVKGKQALAEYLGLDKEFIAWRDFFTAQTIPVAGNKGKNRTNKIAIYHTHSAESYVPTDGTESRPGEGGIFKVGKAFAAELEKSGVQAIHDTSAHEPRDKNAYNRSRRTAAQLLKKNPATLIDVHRDGVPDADFYRREIDGKKVTQLRLVVGRQNPKMESNKEFAKKVMASTNDKYPKLIKEIFIAKGNYNQDLTPTAMLVEVGTHSNSRQAAEKGITLFADALPGVLGIGNAGAAPGTYGDPGANVPGGWSTVGILLAVVIIGGGAFLLISSGSWENAKDRLNSYASKEFVNLLLPGRTRKTRESRKSDDNED